MAKKGKKSIGSSKKKGGSKNKSNSFITRLIVIIFVLILAFFLIFSVFRPSPKTVVPDSKTTVLNEGQTNNSTKPVDNANPKEEVKEEAKAKDKAEEPKSKKEEKKAAETAVVEQSITGKWMSTTGGAFLTMGNNTYTIDFMGVDSDKAIKGTYSVDGDLITFINKEDPCKDVKGLYEVKFDKQEIAFKCKSDDCTKRKATLPTDWAWLDIE